ncbi:MAG: tryptophan synthase subunit alpha [Candidatus Gracilibacteria bacterium]|nr:tryptophan synthase subunit alpha [Candidatus Gracilibacteria bacterium]
MNTLMTHIVAGYPSMQESEQIALTMLESGVKYLEIQIPFSDPIADGATIMQANQDSLQNGTTPEDCFSLMNRLSMKTDTPLLFMTYFNIVHHYGVEEFCKRAQEVGCWGLIVPDIPMDEEEYDHYLELCKKYKLNAIQVISPITPEHRLKKIGEVASGFVYCVSRTGTTGARSDFNVSQLEYLENVRKHVSTPLATAFGLSNRKQIDQALKKADIAVVGSKIIKVYDEDNDMQNLSSFLSDLIQ